jgi:predicted restriction endonuclease
MSNTSQLDRHIWQEFYGRWDTLAGHADATPAAAAEPAEREAAPPEGPTETIAERKVRRGQQFFRAAVAAAHDGKCCITGISCPALLRASHIVPWAADPLLRLDPRNGLCLNALHDAAFDRALITLSERFELRVSTRLRDEVPPSVYNEMFAGREGQPIKLPERFSPLATFVEAHRARFEEHAA